MTPYQILVVAVGVGVFLLGLWRLLREDNNTGGQAGIKASIFEVSGSSNFVSGVFFLLVGGAITIVPFTPVWPEVPPFTDSDEVPTEPTAVVHDVRGMQEADGQTRLEGLGFEVATRRLCSPHIEAGRVFATYSESVYGTGRLADGDASGQTVSTEQGLTIFVSDGACTERHCSSVRPMRTDTVRFGTGEDHGDVRVILGPGEGVGYRLSVRAGQVIEVTTTYKQAGYAHFICILDTEGQPIAAGSSLQVTTPPLRASGEHLILFAERAGVASEYDVRFFVPAR
jgi:hypothetical protein